MFKAGLESYLTGLAVHGRIRNISERIFVFMLGFRTYLKGFCVVHGRIRLNASKDWVLKTGLETCLRGLDNREAGLGTPLKTLID